MLLPTTTTASPIRRMGTLKEDGWRESSRGRRIAGAVCDYLHRTHAPALIRRALRFFRDCPARLLNLQPPPRRPRLVRLRRKHLGEVGLGKLIAPEVERTG